MKKNIDLEEAIISRRSVRAYLDKKVNKKIIESILLVARRAPSGTNIQPWNVHVLTGSKLEKVSKESQDAFINEKKLHQNDRLHYMEVFREPYVSRRRKVGWDLYSILGIKKGEYNKTKLFHAQNFNFFGAPVGLIFTIEKDLGWMSWLDYGMFIQNICLASRNYDLHTCPQASWGQMNEILKSHISIPENHIVHCGMSLGYEDQKAEVNKLYTEREALNKFVHFYN
tara:strand:- start:32 stop:712 length:681 start_codon:yes stop_codon:yes gene_type:complete